MNIEDKLSGKYIYLRSVAIEDAEFICDIRGNAELCKYVHAVAPDVEKQRKWIAEQIDRAGDYYFVMCTHDGTRIGLASIYGIDAEERCAEFGRWVSVGNAIQNVESVILSFDFAFENLGLDYVYMRTMMDNVKVRNFWNSFGAESLGEVHEMGLRLDKEIVTSKAYYGKLRDRGRRLLRIE